MMQLNTRYPATAYLMGFLRQHAAALNLELAQADASIELFLRMFSGRGLQQILDELTARAEHTDEAMPPSIASLLEHGSATSRRSTRSPVRAATRARAADHRARAVPESPRFAAAVQGPGAGALRGSAAGAA
jgi:hypothetical protein